MWSVSRAGFPGSVRESQSTRGPVARVLQALGDIEEAGDALDYFPEMSRRANLIDELLEAYPDSEPAMVRTLSLYASYGDSLYLGNSMPIREWNLFAQWERPIPNVRANRGANGIDGQLSTWLGWTAEQKETWAVVGDLTALYDLAAPMLLGQTDNEGRVLGIINNGGGKIFQRLPRLESLSPRAAECLLNPQSADFSGMAKLWDMRHVRISRADEFDLFEGGGGTVLLEIVPDEEQTKQFWAAWDKS